MGLKAISTITASSAGTNSLDAPVYTEGSYPANYLVWDSDNLTYAISKVSDNEEVPGPTTDAFWDVYDTAAGLIQLLLNVTEPY